MKSNWTRQMLQLAKAYKQGEPDEFLHELDNLETRHGNTTYNKALEDVRVLLDMDSPEYEKLETEIDHEDYKTQFLHIRNQLHDFPVFHQNWVESRLPETKREDLDADIQMIRQSSVVQPIVRERDNQGKLIPPRLQAEPTLDDLNKQIEFILDSDMSSCDVLVQDIASFEDTKKKSKRKKKKNKSNVDQKLVLLEEGRLVDNQFNFLDGLIPIAKPVKKDERKVGKKKIKTCIVKKRQPMEKPGAVEEPIQKTAEFEYAENSKLEASVEQVLEPVVVRSDEPVSVVQRVQSVESIKSIERVESVVKNPIASNVNLSNESTKNKRSTKQSHKRQEKVKKPIEKKQSPSPIANQDMPTMQPNSLEKIKLEENSEIHDAIDNENNRMDNENSTMNHTTMNDEINNNIDTSNTPNKHNKSTTNNSMQTNRDNETKNTTNNGNPMHNNSSTRDNSMQTNNTPIITPYNPNQSVDELESMLDAICLPSSNQVPLSIPAFQALEWYHYVLPYYPLAYFYDPNMYFEEPNQWEQVDNLLSSRWNQFEFTKCHQE